MRPDVDEQLSGIARILERVVAPAVTDAYAADVLTGVTAVLDGIANGWADVAGFLAWDARETLALDRRALPGARRRGTRDSRPSHHCRSTHAPSPTTTRRHARCSRASRPSSP